MTDSRIYADLSALLSNNQPTLMVLKRVIASHLTWDEFLQMRLPDEMSPVATWDLVRSLKRSMGIELPVPDMEGNKYWYLRTHEIADSIAQIQCLCRADSGLYRRLTSTKNTTVLVCSRINETIAAAHLDGLEVTARDYNDMLRSHRLPRTDNERLVTNTLGAIDRLDDFVNEPFSFELLMHLRDLVMKDVDPEGLVSTQTRLGTVAFDYDDAVVAEHADQQLKHICDYANHLTGDTHDHPVYRGLLLPELFRFYRPLPDANSQVGRLVFRLYAQKAGIPVLGLLPISQVKLDWEDGKLGTSLVSFEPRDYAKDRRIQGSDLTDHATLSVQLALVALLDLNWKLEALEREDENLRTLLQEDPEINHRQRSILGRALKTPDAEFRIAYHKTTHNVVYATARADLLELEDKGFLVMNKKGRAMVFTPRENLHSYIKNEYQRTRK